MTNKFKVFQGFIKVDVSTKKYKDMFCLIDFEDLFKIDIDGRWRAHRAGNGHLSVVLQSRDKGQIFMHRLITDAIDGTVVDHINGDTLDNRKFNLRFATIKENLWNSTTNRKNFSGYKGVYLEKRSGRWISRICKDGVRKHLGSFKTKEDAASAYDKAAVELFGSFARTNNILGD